MLSLLLSPFQVLSCASPQPSTSLDSHGYIDLLTRFPRLIRILLDCHYGQTSTTRDATVMAIFSIDCTLPPHGATFVQPPNARGTLDIVYSCLAVIVLCTWSILHLNVPTQITPADGRQKLMRSLFRTLTKVKWMAFNVLAPEWPFARALCGFLSLRQLQKRFDCYSDDRVSWTRSHTQLANMGGFVVRFDRTRQDFVHSDLVVEHGAEAQCVFNKYCCNGRWIVGMDGMMHFS